MDNGAATLVCSLGDEIDNGQQQERFMRRAEFGCDRPARATGVGAEGGEGFDVVVNHTWSSVIIFCL